jgi:hypothetical protein
VLSTTDTTGEIVIRSDNGPNGQAGDRNRSASLGDRRAPTGPCRRHSQSSSATAAETPATM